MKKKIGKVFVFILIFSVILVSIRLLFLNPNNSPDEKDSSIKVSTSISISEVVPDGYIKPEGTLNIDSNGIYDVFNYENVDININFETFENALIDGSLTSFYNDEVTSIRAFCFKGYQTLTSIELPNVKTIGQESFAGTRCIKPIMPSLEVVGIKAFDYSYLQELEAPLKNIYAHAFIGCPIKSLIITQEESVCKLQNTNAFDGSSISSGTGFVYVPDSMYESYLANSMWSTFASQIKPRSEYVEEELFYE